LINLIKILFLFLVNRKKKNKHVTFRLGADGNEWCWVMGESDSDEQLNNKFIFLSQSFKFSCFFFRRINNENINRQNQLRLVLYIHIIH
jgi:hypothetical protein